MGRIMYNVCPVTLLAIKSVFKKQQWYLQKRILFDDQSIKYMNVFNS